MMNKLTTMNDEDFARLVAEEVKNKLSPLQKAQLHLEENWSRWKSTLIALIENLNDQVARIDADMDADVRRYESFGEDGLRLRSQAEAAYVSRRKKVERFRFHVERRLDDVASMIETGQVKQSDGWDDVEFYRRAIIRHRAMIRDLDLEETPIDRALWASLDKSWDFDKVDVSRL
jgi:hypothetical protein